MRPGARQTLTKVARWWTNDTGGSVLACGLLLALALAAFSPTLRVFLTFEFERHFRSVLCRNERVSLSLVAEEMRRFGKLRPVGTLAHVALLAAFRDAPLVSKAVMCSCTPAQPPRSTWSSAAGTRAAWPS